MGNQGTIRQCPDCGHVIDVDDDHELDDGRIQCPACNYIGSPEEFELPGESHD